MYVGYVRMYVWMYVGYVRTHGCMYVCTQKSPITQGFTCLRTEIFLVTIVRELNVMKF